MEKMGQIGIKAKLFLLVQVLRRKKIKELGKKCRFNERYKKRQERTKEKTF